VEKRQVITLIGILTLAGSTLEIYGAVAAPPSQASATSPTKDAPRAPSPDLTYQTLAPNLLARTLFSGSGTGPVAVEIDDIVVGPGQTAQLATQGFAALIEVQAGSARVTLDGKPVEPQSGGVFSVPEGRSIEIDNSGETRPFLARAYKLSAAGK
jgi:hypothetical protein